MRLDLSPDEQLHVETTRRFLAAEGPISTVRAWAAQPLGYDPAWWRRGADLGWTSLLAPDEFSGGSISGAELLDLTSVAHAFGVHVAPGPLVSVNIAVLAVSQLGTMEQKERLLPSLLDGTVVAAWAGSSTTQVPTARQGDRGVLVVDGVLVPVEAGPGTAWLIVAVSTADGLRQVVIPTDADGVTIEPLHGLDLNRRFVRVQLEGVVVAATDVLGVGGEHESAPDDVTVSAAIARQLQTATVVQLAESCGCIDRVLEFTLEWLFDRHSFGRPLASYQELKHRAADMRMWAEACHATADAAARALQHDDPDAEMLVHVAASWVGDRAVDIVQDCVQMHGGIGVTAEHDIHLYLRRVAQNRQLLGTPDEHRRAVTAHVERLLA